MNALHWPFQACFALCGSDCNLVHFVNFHLSLFPLTLLFFFLLFPSSHLCSCPRLLSLSPYLGLSLAVFHSLSLLFPFFLPSLFSHPLFCSPASPLPLSFPPPSPSLFPYPSIFFPPPSTSLSLRMGRT